MATHLVMIKDSETGENMKEFLQNLDNWKERNKVILLELSQQSKLGKIGVTKGTSSTSLFSKKSTQELDKRLQQFSIVKKVPSFLIYLIIIFWFNSWFTLLQNYLLKHLD